MKKRDWTQLLTMNKQNNRKGKSKKTKKKNLEDRKP